MRVAVTGASGLIGSELVPTLGAAGHTVVRLVRREPRCPDEVRWDPERGDAAGIPAGALDGVDAVVHLAGAGVGDRRWSDEWKRQIVDSRVLGTRTVVRALAASTSGPATLVSASAVGYYGSRGDEELTEAAGPGTGFLADATRAWEAEATRAEDAGVRTVRLRTGLVMADKGGAFDKLLPVFRAGAGGRLGDGTHWWPWITLEDEVRAITFCLERADVAGPVNLGSPHPARNADVAAALGRALSRPAVVPVPAFALRLALGEFASDVLASQRMLPTVLQAHGFSFTHPDLDAACRWLVDA